MNPLLKNILCLLIILSMGGCVKGVKTEVVHKTEFSYLKFTGDLDSSLIIIDDGEYKFNLSDSKSKTETLYKIDNGKHRIK